jgi:hypothetical protein
VKSTSDTSVLSALLGTEAHADFVRRFPEEVISEQCEDLPPWLRDPRLQELRHWEQLYHGAIEVTRGKRAQYVVSGAGLAACVEDLDLAVRLSGLERYLPDARPWLGSLERELGMMAGCATISAFFNPPTVGLGPHCDPCEHLLFHLRGTKQIRVFPAEPGSYRSVSFSPNFPVSARDALQFADGFPRFREALPEAVQTIRMARGSLLFLPRGAYHETRGGEEDFSMTVVVQLRVPSMAQAWARYMTDYLMQSAHWRRPALSKFRAHAQRLIATPPRPPSDEVLARCMGGGDGTPDAERARYVRNPAVVVEQPVGGGIRVRATAANDAGESLAFGAEAAALVLAIAAQWAPFKFSDLQVRFPDWDEPSLRAVLRLLVAQGAVMLLDVEELHGTSAEARPLQAEHSGSALRS